MSGHTHAPPSTRHLKWVLLLTGGFLLVELVGGLLSNSLALLSDAGHMLSDVTALSLALVAVTQMKRPPDSRRSFGYRRLEIVSALANGAILCVVAVVVEFQAYHRLHQPPEVRAGLMLAVAVLGLGVNLVGLALLHDQSRRNMGIRGAFLHVLGDALGSVGAIAAGLVIRYTGWMRADAIASFAIGILILISGIHLVRESVHILLEGVPKNIRLPEVEKALRGIGGVIGMHDLHVWRIGSDFDTLTVHLVVDRVENGPARKDMARAMLHSRFGIDHCTIEIEGPGEEDESDHPGPICERIDE
jgi:cobalt-zinc-cadmium efflux system protein